MYVRIRSWHVVRTPSRVPNRYIALCGRSVTTRDTREDLPAERTCERCLQIDTRRRDQADG